MPERCAPRVLVHPVLKTSSDNFPQVGSFLVSRPLYPRKKTRNFCSPVLLQCSACGLLSSSSRLSPRPPLHRTTGPPVRAVLLSHACPFSLLTRHASASGVADPNISCQPYSYPPLDAYVNELPTAWEPAKILPNDAEAWAMWYQISPSILNIPPKLTSIGTCPPDYDFVNDPDCCELLFHLRSPTRD